MRAPVVFLTLAFLIGVVLAPAGAPWVYLAAAASALVLVATFAVRRRPGAGSVSAALAFLLLGAASAAVSRHEWTSSELEALHLKLGEKRFVDPTFVTGTLRREPELLADRTVLTLDAESIRVARKRYRVRGGLRVSVRGERRDRLRSLVRGDRVALWARLRRPTFFANPGGFDGKSYLRRERLELTGSAKSALLVERPAPVPLARSVVSRLRLWTWKGLASQLGRWPETHGVTVALVTGERSLLSPRIETLYRKAGIFHVMAISGAHVAIVLFVLNACLRRAGMDEAPALTLLLAALPLYALYCGGRPPVVRAAMMASIWMGARLLSLDRPRANGLALAALLLLAWDPLNLEDPGFQLTFGAMASLVLFAPRLERRISVLGPLAAPAAIAVSAQMGVLVFLVAHFGRLHPLAAPASLVAMPVAGAVVVLGLVVVPVSSVPLFGEAASRLLHLGVRLLTAIAEHTASLPLASVRVGAPSPGWTALYVLGLLFLLAPSARARRSGAAVLVVLIGLLLAPESPPKGALELTVLDVGHGDALALSLPDGQQVLVDGGGLPGSSVDVGESVILPFLAERGVRRLDAALLTHADYDHIAGLFMVVDELPTGFIGVAPGRSNRAAYEAFRRRASARGIPIRVFRPGRRFQWGGLTWEVLAAGGVHAPDPTLDENDRSLVFRLTYGQSRLLLTGDAGAVLEAELVRSGRELVADVLKLAHHGSRTSTSSAFLEAVRPRLALVSARRSAGRPLPSARVLHRLRARGIDYLRTDRSGAITVTLRRDGRIEVRTHRGSLAANQ